MVEGQVDIEVLRDAVNAAVEATSLRAVAKEIGVSPSGLGKFAKRIVQDLYGPSLRRIVPWYRRRLEAGPRLPDPEDIVAAVDVLVHDLAPEDQEPARVELYGIARDAYVRENRGREEQLTELFASLRTGPRPVRPSDRHAPPPPRPPRAAIRPEPPPVQPGSRISIVFVNPQVAFTVPGALEIPMWGVMPRA